MIHTHALSQHGSLSLPRQLLRLMQLWLLAGLQRPTIMSSTGSRQSVICAEDASIQALTLHTTTGNTWKKPWWNLLVDGETLTR